MRTCGLKSVLCSVSGVCLDGHAVANLIYLENVFLYTYETCSELPSNVNTKKVTCLYYVYKNYLSDTFRGFTSSVVYIVDATFTLNIYRLHI